VNVDGYTYARRYCSGIVVSFDLHQGFMKKKTSFNRIFILQCVDKVKEL